MNDDLGNLSTIRSLYSSLKTSRSEFDKKCTIRFILIFLIVSCQWKMSKIKNKEYPILCKVYQYFVLMCMHYQSFPWNAHFWPRDQTGYIHEKQRKTLSGLVLHGNLELQFLRFTWKKIGLAKVTEIKTVGCKAHRYLHHNIHLFYLIHINSRASSSKRSLHHRAFS